MAANPHQMPRRYRRRRNRGFTWPHLAQAVICKSVARRRRIFLCQPAAAWQPHRQPGPPVRWHPEPAQPRNQTPPVQAISTKMTAAPDPDQQLRGSTTADQRIQQALSQHGGSFASPPPVWLCAKSVALHVDEVACSGLRSGCCKSVASMLLLHQNTLICRYLPLLSTAIWP